MEMSAPDPARFFMPALVGGQTWSAICNYHSTIAVVHCGLADAPHWELTLSSVNFSPQRSSPSWSINAVTDSLGHLPYKRLHNMWLDLLTYKTLFLVAMTSLLTIQPDFTHFDRNGVWLLQDPHFLAKNQTPLFSHGEIWLGKLSSPSLFLEDKLSCPV